MQLSYAMPTIIAIDDWMIWGRATDGVIVETCAEMWPEWLDQTKAPEDMGADEYRIAVLRILRHKRPAWRSTAAVWTDREDLALIVADITALEAAQASFINTNR